MKTCKLWDLIDKAEFEALEQTNYYMDADPEFLCFENVYFGVAKMLEHSKHFTIIDFGCAYGFQSEIFADFAKYIGVDILRPQESFYYPKARNAEYFEIEIQDFIKNELPKLDLDSNNVFAICSYVPDSEARDLVRKTFKNCLVHYPSQFHCT